MRSGPEIPEPIAKGGADGPGPILAFPIQLPSPGLPDIPFATITFL